MFRYVSSRIKDAIRQRHKHRHKYDNYDPVVKKVVDRLELLWEDIIYLRATPKGLRKEEEDYEAYLEPYGEAIEHLTTALTEFATTSRLIFEAEVGFYDEDSARRVLGPLARKLDAWHNLCIKVIDDFRDGDPKGEYSLTIIKTIRAVARLSLTDKQTPTDPIFENIELLMKDALKKKHNPTPKTFDEYGISIIRHQYSRTPMVNVDLDFHFDVQYRGSNKPSVSFFYAWYKEKTPNSLPIVWDTKVASINRSFKPSERDKGKRLKLECFVMVGVDGEILPTNVTITNKVEPFYTDHLRRWKTRGDTGTFNVLSYNILADLHEHCFTSRYHAWEYRREALLLELNRYDVDILCLQEVQDNHFGEFLEPQLRRWGYLVQYKTKNHKVTSKGKEVKDGCATFYRGRRFKKIRHYEVNYEEKAELELEDYSGDKTELIREELVKDNIALILELEDSKNDSLICVVDTLARELQDFTKSKKTAIIICGDFNSYQKSPPYILLVEGSLSPFSELVRDIDEHGFFQNAKNAKLTHELVLLIYAHSKKVVLRTVQESAYAPGELPFTKKYNEILDYIFYSISSISVQFPPNTGTPLDRTVGVSPIEPRQLENLKDSVVYNYGRIEVKISGSLGIAWKSSPPLRVAASNGHDVNVIREIIRHCPDAAELLDSCGRNAFHAAILSGKDDSSYHAMCKPRRREDAVFQANGTDSFNGSLNVLKQQFRLLSFSLKADV
ncbi:Endonuclease/exonuclease/phosphatase [Corchorus capsularis]|uniref:Endonuclease/exonuclease/phosphatase n=1 Tax=Corchorus capsularis TaxID=210143 RepID=A0A1R3GMG8_COCAP|nr:Endonuclease/exonuclease/phosphatase [Corchorus capsularis]